MRFTEVFLSVFASSMVYSMACGTLAFAAPQSAPSAPTVTQQAPAPSPAPTIAPPIAPMVAAPVAAPEVAMTPLPPSTLNTAFQNAITAFQKNDFQTARLWFRETVAKDPAQIVGWYDLGLTEQHLGNTGLAMAFWRKALAISPTFSPAQYALAFTRSRLDHGDIPHEVETWETLRSDVLVYLSAAQFALLAALFFFAAGWFALSYIGRRRRAILDETRLPSYPVSATLSTLVFAILLILTFCKIVDDQDLRATIVVKKIEAKALPDPSSTSLFDLYEGLEVVVRQTNKSWIQVTFPGGATGWIPRDSLFTMADRFTP